MTEIGRGDTEQKILDRLAVAIAVKRKELTSDEATEAQGIQGFFDPPRSLTSILVERGRMDEKRARVLDRRARKLFARWQDEEMLEMLLEEGAIDEEAVRSARSVRDEARASGQKTSMIGHLQESGRIASGAVESIRGSIILEGRLNARLRSVTGESREDLYLTGQCLGDYHLDSVLGEGAWGVTYLGQQLGLERTVAIKVLHQRSTTDPKVLDRFRAEAVLAARMNHPNLVHVYDIGKEDGRPYYSMEFVEGRTLAEVLFDETRIPVVRSVDLVTQVARALQHMHGHNVVHQDIKPENIVLRDDGIIKILDLGLAMKLGDEDEKEGSIVGTPSYIAPEQITQTDLLTPQTDIYSLGATFYHLITGQRPFLGNSPGEILHKVTTEEPQPIEEIDYTIADEVVRICKRMMAKDLDRRYREMGMVLKAFEKLWMLEV